MALPSPLCTPASVRMLRFTLAARSPVFVRYSRMSGAPAPAPVPTNHISELGWAQLTVPIPAAVACSASKPSAIWPVATTTVPDKLAAAGAVTVAGVPGLATVTGWAGSAPRADGFEDGDGLPAGVDVALAVAPGCAVALEGRSEEH